MEKKQVLLLGSVVFGIIAFLHLLRSILNWDAAINGFNVPVWFSYIAVVVAGYLSWEMYSSGKK